MPSLAPLKRSARGFINDVRSTTGSGEDGRDNNRSHGTAQAESNETEDRSWQDAPKRAFLRNLITAKLGSRRDDNSSTSGGSSKSGHDAERATNGTFQFQFQFQYPCLSLFQFPQSLPRYCANRTPTLRHDMAWHSMDPNQTLSGVGVHGAPVTWPPTGPARSRI
ncbi:hypothetical protein NUW58_g10392 [Xylaria curta]|uniref:Uncharacterized protein n=1 Tax=Xylaria curta TaxID=42375 RepID=A0ACC1MN22_9PEZI|nr:hypothetical protein NUW58_g10392 [Xylaria curta]